MDHEVVVLASHDYTSSLLKKEGCDIINFEVYLLAVQEKYVWLIKVLVLLARE